MDFFPKWLNLIHTDGIPDEESRKRIYFLVGISAAIPVLIGYGLIAWIDSDKPLDALLNFVLATCFIVIAIFMIKTTARGLGFYRFGIACLTVLLAYNVGFGPYGQSEALWVLVYPLVAFYLFGTQEGLVWISALIFPSAIFIIFPSSFNAYSYPIQFRIALIIALILSIVLSYLFESLRAHYNSKLEKQNTELLDALAEVKKLSGFIPICASCKKIRDDKGFWNQIEEYIRDHSEAEFSHSMCPQCSDKFYGEQDWYIEMKKNKSSE